VDEAEVLKQKHNYPERAIEFLRDHCTSLQDEYNAKLSALEIRNRKLQQESEHEKRELEQKKSSAKPPSRPASPEREVAHMMDQARLSPAVELAAKRREENYGDSP